nr:MAG TPA: hypothetical protein [Caudoviricetes sp.]
MSAVVPFPKPETRSDLSRYPAAGYAEINRRIALLANEFSPASQAARLILRAASLQAVAHASPVEIATAMRSIADELEAMA